MNLLLCGREDAALADAFARRGHALTVTRDRAHARDLCRTRRVDGLFLELEPGDPALEEVRGVAPDLAVVVLGPEDTAFAAARASARGAFGYVPVAAGAPMSEDARELALAFVERLAARLRLEQARVARLEESARTRKFYEDVLTSVGQGIVVVDQDGKLRFHNPEAARILGEDDGTFNPITGETATPVLQMLVDTLVEGKPRTRMIALEVEEQQKVFLDATSSVLRGADGRSAGAVAIVSDRSTEKRLEEQLIHTERLATLGSLLASIAHEITNTLTSITGCAEMGLEVAKEAETGADRCVDPAARQALVSLGADIRQIFDTVLQAGISCQTIANNMLQYSRQAPPQSLVKQDVNELVKKTIKVLGKHLGTDKVSLTLHLDPSSPSIKLEPSKLQQALVNLVVNAIHALQEVPPPRRNLRVSTRRSPEARELLLEVEDTGPGISPRKQEKIFQPFFTTKGHGTGLGLYISRKVIQDQGGAITLESAPGKGTKFTIHLPLPAE